VSSDLQSPKGFVTGVSGSWVVPEVTLSYDSFSATWVGIGGQYDESLIQTGTEHYSSNGSVGYIAWYELLPADSVELNMTLLPGDVMRASISLQNAATKIWLIEISDATNGQTFSRSISYASSMLSAEWIVERPTVNNFLYPLADFGRISFSDCSATMSGRTDSIVGFPHSAFNLQGRMNNNLMTLSNPPGRHVLHS